MNMYSIGVIIDTQEKRFTVDNPHYIVLAPSLEEAKNYLKKSLIIKEWKFAKPLAHGKYIVGATFVNTEYN